jgi:hypothetical protein
MSKLLKLKKWMSVGDAAGRLSATFGEIVREADIFQFALDGHLTLSVLFVNSVTSRFCRLVKSEEIEWVEIPALDGVRVVRVPANGRLLHTSEGLYFVELGCYQLDGVWDLPLIGGERVDVELAYQNATDGPEVTGVSLEGVFVRSEDGRLFEVQSQTKYVQQARKRTRWDFVGLRRSASVGTDSSRWRNVDVSETITHPAGALPEDCLFVVRTEALTKFEQSMSEEAALNDKPLLTKERRSLLVVIAALAKEAKINLDHPSKAATVIEGLTNSIGAPVAKRTIEEHLKKIPDALDARKK